MDVSAWNSFYQFVIYNNPLRVTRKRSPVSDKKKITIFAGQTFAIERLVRRWNIVADIRFRGRACFAHDAGVADRAQFWTAGCILHRSNGRGTALASVSNLPRPLNGCKSRRIISGGAASRIGGMSALYGARVFHVRINHARRCVAWQSRREDLIAHVLL